MRTIDASVVFAGAVGLLTGSPNVPLSRLQSLRSYVDRALQEAWEAEHWPDLVRQEERNYRLAWNSGTTYAASTSTTAVEVWFAPTQKYYQSLVGSNLNNPPATQSGTTWTENSDKWAESKTAYSGPDWATGVAYVATDGAASIVRRTSGTDADYRYYQCHTGHTSGGSFDTSKFCILTPFDAYVAFSQTGKTAIGECFVVNGQHPRLTRGLTEYKFWISENGVQVPNGPATVWLTLRTRRPVLVGDVFSSTATYAVGQQVYFTNTTTGIGNFYDCASATTAGESPTSAAAKWTLVELPYIFGMYLMHSAHADLLASDGQADKSLAARGVAQSYLTMETDKLYRQQRQAQPLRVVGY